MREGEGYYEEFGEREGVVLFMGFIYLGEVGEEGKEEKEERKRRG